MVQVVLLCGLLGAVQVAGEREERWGEDLDSLAKALAEKHVNPFTRVSKGQFEAAVAELRKSIPTMNDAQVGVGLMKLTAMLGDGHTMLGPSGTKAVLRNYP